MWEEQMSIELYNNFAATRPFEYIFAFSVGFIVLEPIKTVVTRLQEKLTWTPLLFWKISEQSI